MDELYVPKTIKRSTLIEKSEWLFSILDTHDDLDKTRSSRFCEVARAILRDGPDVIPSDRPDFNIVRQAVKDLRELEFMWAILNPSPSHPKLWSKFKTVFGDKSLPSAGSKENQARNAQFELLVLSILERTGLYPKITESGADFTAAIGSTDICVEAKRITSIKRLEARVRGAARQIEFTGLTGFICLDFSYAVNPGDQVFVLNSPIEEFEQAQQKRFRAFWKDHGKRIRRAIGDRRVIGITFFDHLIMQTGINDDKSVGKWELASIRDNYFLGSKVSGGRKLADSFFDLTGSLGLPVEAV